MKKLQKAKRLARLTAIMLVLVLTAAMSVGCGGGNDGSSGGAGGEPSPPAPTGGPEPEEGAGPEETPAPEPGHEPEQEPAGQPEETVAPADYTLSGDPAAADFAWYMDGGRTTDLLPGAAPVTDMAEAMGDWKLFIWIDPDHIAYNESSYSLGLVNIDDAGGAITMVVQELLMVDEDGTTQDISMFEAEKFTGALLPDQKGVYAGESWNRYTVSEFYAAGGKQYGLGILEVQSGEPCYIALVRP
ncbi:MAG: hypothetical protein FWG03_07980 [Clostridiales bacterium]|nr:hypothetical protein [Clostridiales bacterium]